MNFPINQRGGWIIPENADLPSETHVPAYSEIGNVCTLGDDCKLGNGCTLGDDCKLGNGCTLGNYCKLGDGCKLGNGCTIGNDCTLGDGCKLGDDCKLEGIVAKRWLTMANVDGSGRKILIVTDGKTTKVRAGCFIGSPQEFSDKAKAENKPLYATLVPFVANQLRCVRWM
jgi:NDP-sugar pyrophosphorylase family protein